MSVPRAFCFALAFALALLAGASPLRAAAAAPFLLHVGGAGSPRPMAAAVPPPALIADPSVPRPAGAYAPLPSDAGPEFREGRRAEGPDGGTFANLLVPPDAAQDATGGWGAASGRPIVATYIWVLPPGSDAELAAGYGRVLAELRDRQGFRVEPALGWGSEQVHSYARVSDGLMFRGVALKHRNAVVHMEMSGAEDQATWERLSRLMGAVEGRIHAALQG
jgi:hypothetical protein